jgi:hypothetical protein
LERGVGRGGNAEKFRFSFPAWWEMENERRWIKILLKDNLNLRRSSDT